MNEKDVNIYCLYELYKDYKFLYEFWKKFQNKRVVSDDELRERMEYILKNKVKQRDEISTICWILGVEDERFND